MAKKLQKEAEELSEHFLGCGVTHNFTGARYANGMVEVSFDSLNTIQVGPLSVILCYKYLLQKGFCTFTTSVHQQ